MKTHLAIHTHHGHLISEFGRKLGVAINVHACQRERILLLDSLKLLPRELAQVTTMPGIKNYL